MKSYKSPCHIKIYLLSDLNNIQINFNTLARVEANIEQIQTSDV